MNLHIALVILFGIASATQFPGIDVSFNLSPFDNQTPAIANPFVNFYNGVISGVVQTFQFDKALFEDCIGSPEEVYEDWLEYIAYLKTITWANLDIMELFGNTMEVVMSSVGDVIPCIILYSMTKKYIALIKDPTWETLQYVLIQTLATNAQMILNDTIGIVTSIFKGDLFACGQCFGQIVYVVIVH